MTITVTTYSCAEWWRVTACFDSAKPRGSKIHWSGGCDPAVSMLPLARYARGLATVTLPPLAPPPPLMRGSTARGTHHDPSRPAAKPFRWQPLLILLDRLTRHPLFPSVSLLLSIVAAALCFFSLQHSCIERVYKVSIEGVDSLLKKWRVKNFE